MRQLTHTTLSSGLSVILSQIPALVSLVSPTLATMQPSQHYAPTRPLSQSPLRRRFSTGLSVTIIIETEFLHLLPHTNSATDLCVRQNLLSSRLRPLPNSAIATNTNISAISTPLQNSLLLSAAQSRFGMMSSNIPITMNFGGKAASAIM